MGKYAEQTCCFTGHRDIPAGEEIKIKTRVYHRIQPLIQQGVIYYGVGGALGFATCWKEETIGAGLPPHSCRTASVNSMPCT